MFHVPEYQLVSPNSIWKWDGKEIVHTIGGKWIVQFRKNGSYKNMYSSENNPMEMYLYYRCVNVGNGYTKRFIYKNEYKTVVLDRCRA